ncbi:AP-1-like transcription factor [Extremus antarcticus]|uniref:AP-1-like transcription factor n=1 Tax=Extremus antarcticus TaxID=702011 RepID=A0AAJ0DEC4_9PEZI|nr:AP-1-like transcription factor [Extremus antarcticus]
MSQLFSSPLAIADQDMVNFNHMQAKAGSCFTTPLPTPGCKSEQIHSFLSTPWEMAPPLSEIPSLMSRSASDSSSPSSSTSLHEGFIGVQQEQHQKRRAQNRAAQRAYRDRKMRHTADLEIGIRDIEDNIRRLQSENTELIRQLSDIKAENEKWKQSQYQTCTAARDEFSRRHKAVSTATKAENSVNHPNKSENDTDRDQDAASDDVFDAVWNLIELDPALVKGNAKAEAFLKRLRDLVESGSQQESKSSRSDSAVDIDGAHNAQAGKRPG